MPLQLSFPIARPTCQIYLGVCSLFQGVIAVVLCAAFWLVCPFIDVARAAGDETRLKGGTFRLTVPLRLGNSPQLTIDQGVLIFEPVKVASHEGETKPDTDYDSAGELPKDWSALFLKEKLSHIHIRQGVLTLDLRAEKTALAPELLLEALLKDSWFSNLSLETCQLKVLRPQGVPLVFMINHGDFSVDLNDGELEGKGVLIAFEQASQFEMSLEYKAYAIANDADHDFRVAIKSQLFDWQFDGKMNGSKGLSLKGKSEFHLFDSAGINLLLPMGQAGPPLKSLPAGAPRGRVKTAVFTAAGQLDWTGARARLTDGTFEFGGNKAEGALSLKQGEHNHMISGALAFERLSLESVDFSALLLPEFLTKRTAQDDETSPRKETIARREFTDRVRQLHQIIRSFDADLRLSAEELILGPLKIEDTGFSLYQKAGKLIVDMAEVSLLGGSARGHLKIDTKAPKPRWHINTQFSDIDLARLKKTIAVSPFTQGQGALKLHLTSFGDKADEIRHNMFGALVFEAPEGGELELDVELLLPDKHPVGPDPAAFTAGKTAFQQLEAIGHVAKGALVTDFLSLKTKMAEFTGKGHLNLSQGGLDWHIAAWQIPAEVADPQEKNNDLNAASPILLSCTFITGDWLAPQMKTRQALHLSLLNQVCPALYRPLHLKNHDDTIVPE